MDYKQQMFVPHSIRGWEVTIKLLEIWVHR
jgi:hypothetical protein